MNSDEQRSQVDRLLTNIAQLITKATNSMQDDYYKITGAIEGVLTRS